MQAAGWPYLEMNVPCQAGLEFASLDALELVRKLSAVTPTAWLKKSVGALPEVGATESAKG
jgi:hypothetical protein